MTWPSQYYNIRRSKFTEGGTLVQHDKKQSKILKH